MESEKLPDLVGNWLDHQAQFQDAEAVTEIPRVELEEEDGAIVECGVEHIISPGLFYINLTNKKYKGLELFQLNEDLKRHMIHSWNNFYQPVQCGDFVAVKERIDGNGEIWTNDQITGNFFRGQILDEIKENRKVKVFLVDFGDTIEVCHKDIRPLPEAFATFPQFALPCCLKNVRPLEGDGCPPDTVQLFRSLAPREKIFRFQFEKTKEVMYPLKIDLFIDENCDKTIAQILIERGYVKPIKPPVIWNPMAADYMKPVMVANSEGPMDGFDRRSEDRLCKFYRFNGNCRRGINCGFLHVQTGSPFNMSDDDTVMTVAHHELNLPPKGTEIPNISIPVVRHLQCFYAILKQDDKERAKELSEEMTEFYNTCRTFNDNERPLIPGEIVAAQNEGKWYRARIIEVLNENANGEEYSNDFVSCMEKVRVFFVDYGQASTLYMDSIREIKKSFLELPFQAVECSLGKVVPLEDEDTEVSGMWPDQTKREFRDMTRSCFPIRAKVLSVIGKRLELDLDYDKEGNDRWINIADKLVSMGLAATEPRKHYTPSRRALLICPG